MESLKKVNYIYWKRLVLVHLKRYYKNMYTIALSCFLTHFYFAWEGTLRPSNCSNYCVMHSRQIASKHKVFSSAHLSHHSGSMYGTCSLFALLQPCWPKSSVNFSRLVRSSSFIVGRIDCKDFSISFYKIKNADEKFGLVFKIFWPFNNWWYLKVIHTYTNLQLCLWAYHLL